jgi:hypothetical protein
VRGADSCALWGYLLGTGWSGFAWGPECWIEDRGAR